MTFQICSGIHNTLRMSALNQDPIQELPTDKLQWVKVATQVNFLKMYHKMIIYHSNWTVMLEYDEYNAMLLCPASWHFNKYSTKIYPTWCEASTFTVLRYTSLLLKTNQLSTCHTSCTQCEDPSQLVQKTFQQIHLLE